MLSVPRPFRLGRRMSAALKTTGTGNKASSPHAVPNPWIRTERKRSSTIEREPAPRGVGKNRNGVAEHIRLRNSAYTDMRELQRIPTGILGGIYGGISITNTGGELSPPVSLLYRLNSHETAAIRRRHRHRLTDHLQPECYLLLWRHRDQIRTRTGSVH